MRFGRFGISVGGGGQQIIGDIIELKIRAHDIGDKLVEFTSAFEEVLQLAFVEKGL